MSATVTPPSLNDDQARRSSIRIFISYRRGDSADVSGRIGDRLQADFGAANVFKDVNSIPVGVDFEEYISEQLQQCDVVLVLIGPSWASVTNRDGRPRLHDPADLVRIEIEQALHHKRLVIPTLVGHAHMPDVALLPESIQKLTRRNASQVRPDPDFHRDMDRLVRELQQYQTKLFPHLSSFKESSPLKSAESPNPHKEFAEAPENLLRVPSTQSQGESISVAESASSGQPRAAVSQPAQPSAPVPASVVSARPQASGTLPMIDSAHRARDEQTATAARLGIDLTWTNFLGINFRLIPAGEYRAGPTTDGPCAKPGARPVRVKIERPFWAARFVLTNAMIAAFLDDPGEEKALATDRLFAAAARRGEDDDLPCTHISAADAAVLCRWLNRREPNRRFRLPTEAEWEFLARAGVEMALHPRIPLAPTTGPSAADSRRVNPFGLVDVVGNVSEWTATPFAFQLDAAALTRTAEASSGSLAVRGGSWRYRPEELTLAWRKSVAATRRSDDLGVRLVCDLAERGATDE